MMEEICLDIVNGVSPYPIVDDPEDGDIVYATVSLNGEGSEASEVYALPGTVTGGGKVVELFETELWARKELAKIETVEVTEGLVLRRGAARAEVAKDDKDEEEEEEEEENEECIDSAWDDVGLVADVARDQVAKSDKNFSKYLDYKTDAEGKVFFDDRKWELLRAITVKMAGQVTATQFKEYNDVESEQVQAKFKTEFLEPCRAEAEADKETEEERKEYRKKTSNLRTGTTLKYVCLIMEVVINGPEGKLQGVPKAKGDATARLQAQMAALSTQIAVLSSQMKLTAPGSKATEPASAPAEAKVKRLKVPPDNLCAYHVMSAGSAKSLDPNAKIDSSPEGRKHASSMARKTVCLEANKEWKHDKKAFEDLYGPFQVFMAEILKEEPNPNSWPEFYQWRLHAKANRQLEYRIKHLVKKGSATEVQTYSTKTIGSPQPKYVMFPIYNGSHYDIGAVEQGGELAYVFPASEADAAGKLIDAFLGGVKKVHFADGLDEQELSELLDGVLGLSEGLNEEPFTAVENRNSKKRRKKAEAAKKAAEAEKKASAQAEAAKDARTVKVLQEAVKKAVAGIGGGAFAKKGGAATGWASAAAGWVSQPAPPPPPATPKRGGPHWSCASTGGVWGRIEKVTEDSHQEAGPGHENRSGGQDRRRRAACCRVLR